MTIQTIVQQLRGSGRNEWGQNTREVQEAFRRRQQARYERDDQGLRIESQPHA